MADRDQYLNAADKAKLALLIARGAKRGLAGITEMPDIERKIAKVYRDAEARSKRK